MAALGKVIVALAGAWPGVLAERQKYPGRHVFATVAAAGEMAGR